MLTLAPGGETGHHYGTMRAILFALVLTIGCGSATDSAAPVEPIPGTEPSTETGGQTSEVLATGGAASLFATATGGAETLATGGASVAPDTGGALATGGKSANATGGARSTGGAVATGGSKATGGAQGTGGSIAPAYCVPPVYNPECVSGSCTSDCDTCSTESVDPLYWVEMHCKCLGGYMAMTTDCTITKTHN